MRLMIYLKSMTPQAFMALSETSEFFEEMRQRGHSWRVFSDHLQADQAVQSQRQTQSSMILTSMGAAMVIPGKQSARRSLEGAIVWLTDDPDFAVRAADQGAIVFGLGSAAFRGTAVVFETATSLSVRYLEMQVCHLLRIPYVVASQDDITLRESISDDFVELFAIFEESQIPMFAVERPEPAGGETAAGSIQGEKTSDHSVQENYGDRALEIDKSRQPIRRRLRLNTHKLEVRAAYEQYLKHQYSFYGYGLWTVLDQDGSIAGWCGLTSGEDTPELGYIIKKEKRGRQLAAKACRMALAFAADELAISRISLFVREDNEASRHLAQKLGFKKIGDSAGILHYQLLTFS